MTFTGAVTADVLAGVTQRVVAVAWSGVPPVVVVGPLAGEDVSASFVPPPLPLPPSPPCTVVLQAVSRPSASVTTKPRLTSG